MLARQSSVWRAPFLPHASAKRYREAVINDDVTENIIIPFLRALGALCGFKMQHAVRH
jgi:hypothetical protein